MPDALFLCVIRRYSVYCPYKTCLCVPKPSLWALSQKDFVTAADAAARCYYSGSQQMLGGQGSENAAAAGVTGDVDWLQGSSAWVAPWQRLASSGSVAVTEAQVSACGRCQCGADLKEDPVIVVILVTHLTRFE
jgi:hypothetical protein